MPRKKKFKPHYPEVGWSDEKCKWHFRRTDPLFSSMTWGIPKLADQCCCMHLLKSHHISVVNTDLYSDMNEKKFHLGRCLKKVCGCKGFNQDNLEWLLQQGKQDKQIGV